MTQRISWGIIGSGQIANIFAAALAQSKTGKLLAVASRSHESSNRFGESWSVPRRYNSYAQLLKDEDVQIVYIAIPNVFHLEWAINACNYKKHVLCEKPLGLNTIEAKTIIEAAQSNNVFLAEAFMYLFHPQTRKLIEIIRKGMIGDIKVIQAEFSIRSDQTPEKRWMSNALGGGSILDVGGYCTSFARLVAGAAAQKGFVEPTKVTGVGYIGNTNVDEYALASLEFPGGIQAQLFCGLTIDAGANATIHGSEGSIHIPWPFFTAHPGEHMALIVKHNKKKEPYIIETDSDIGLYTLEIDAVAKHINTKQAPEILHNDTLGNMNTLDRWREAIGLVYETEQVQR